MQMFSPFLSVAFLLCTNQTILPIGMNIVNFVIKKMYLMRIDMRDIYFDSIEGNDCLSDTNCKREILSLMSQM